VTEHLASLALHAAAAALAALGAALALGSLAGRPRTRKRD
jgi:hypothetical protein